MSLAPESSGSPTLSTIPLTQPEAPSNRHATPSDLSMIPSTQSTLLPDQPCAPFVSLDFVVLQDVDEGSADTSSPATESQQVAASQPHSHPDVGQLDLALSNGAGARADAEDQSVWMKQKQTLKYLRGTFKLGNLLDVIGHWYRLEKLLGFPETVSVVVQFSQKMFIPLTTSRPWQDSRLRNAHLSSVCSTRIDITTERTMVLRSTPSAVKSWSGGLRYPLPVEYRRSSLGDQQGFPPSWSFSHGGARSSRPGWNPNILTTSIRSKISIVPCWWP
jgi:hypothetical protein